MEWSLHSKIKCDHLASIPWEIAMINKQKRIMIIICRIIAHTKCLHDLYINHSPFATLKDMVLPFSWIYARIVTFFNPYVTQI